MGLLQKLKSALGLNGTESSGSGPSGDVDVTVEREPSTESEDAVKGTETASSGGATAPEEPTETDTSTQGGAPAETEAPASAESTPDEPADDEPTETDASAEETEPEADAEAPPEPEATATDAEAAPPTEQEPDDEADAEAAEELEGSTDPVTELSGIGPAYADRLAGVGIETVGELAAADAAEVAEDIDLGESRVAGWVEQARAY